MADRQEMIDRLRSSNRGLQVSSAARSQHFAAITEALEDVRPHPQVVTKRRRAVVVMAVVVVVLIGASTTSAAAESNAVPGDTIYRTKRAAEALVSVVDSGLIANNCLAELEVLIPRGAEPSVV